MPELLVIGIVVLFPIVFGLFWCFVVWLLAQVGGWARLGAMFPAGDEPAGERFDFQSFRMGVANYKNIVTVVLSEKGLYLRPFFLFRIGHPPLLIPWNQLLDPRQKNMLFFKYMQVTIGNPGVTTISLYSTLYERIRRFVEQRVEHSEQAKWPVA